MNPVVTDVVVLGGGAVGLASALALSARGLAVTVVERGPLGGEASSAAGGILAPQCEAHGPGPMLELCKKSRALWPAFARRLSEATGIDVGYRDDGTLAVALDDDEAEQLLRRLAWQREHGLVVERLDAGEVRALEPALSTVKLGLRFAGDHQVDNLLVVRALGQAIARAGVRVVDGTARRVLHDRTRVSGVDVDGRALKAEHVVVACGSWSSLVEGAGLPPDAVKPIRGQMIELEVRPAPLRHVIFGDDGYLVPRRDGRVLCGSTEEHTGFVKQVTPAGLQRLSERVRRLCPSLAEAPIARSWSGLRPGTRDGLPLLGRGALGGLHLATGHFRNGILLLPVTAEIVVASVTSAPPPVPIEPFSPLRFA